MWQVIKRLAFILFVLATLPLVFVVYGVIGVKKALEAIRWNVS